MQNDLTHTLISLTILILVQCKYMHMLSLQEIPQARLFSHLLLLLNCYWLKS